MLETGVASLLGTLVGLGVYLAGRELLHRPDAAGSLALPTDVLPPTGVIVALVVGLPVLAALASAADAAGGHRDPVRGGAPGRPGAGPRPWAGLLIVSGLAAFALFNPVLDWYRTASGATAAAAAGAARRGRPGRA